MTDPEQTGTERILDEGERARQVARGDYGDTELEAKIHGPSVTSDEYYERLKITKLDPDETATRYGWTKLTLPPDPEVIDQFITVLMQASLSLSELREEPARLGGLVEKYGQNCADCSRKAPVYGPINFDGERYEPGDFCCRTCAIDRGVVEGARVEDGGVRDV